MKISIFISTILLLLNYYNLHAQELYGDRLSPYIDGRGNDLYNEANRTFVNPSLLSKSERRIAEKHSLRRKTMLLAEANRRLHFDILQTRQLARKASRAQSHDDMVADAWHSSPTGKRDGRKWSELFDDEQADYRTRYYEYYNRKKHSPRIIPVTSRYYISEEEFTRAWKQNPVSKRDGRAWDEIPEGTEKESFREKYRNFKQANEAWLNSDDNPFYDRGQFVTEI